MSMPGICVEYFLSFPQTNLSLEKAETNQVFTFHEKPFDTGQFGKIDALVNFSTQN